MADRPAGRSDESLSLFGDGSTPGADSPPSRVKPRRRGRRVMGVFFTILLTVLVIAGGLAFYYLNRVSNAIDNIKQNPTMMPSTDSTDSTGPTVTRPPVARSTPGAKNQPMTFVLMGSDSRGTDQGRSDSLMVAYLSGDRKNIYLISFPRDMWVDIPGRGKAKINAAYAYGGPALTIQTLEQLTDVRMNHAGLIDFPGFIQLTEALGGVMVYNKHATQTGTFIFPEGWITLKGEPALVYVRERYNLPNGDLDRAERQRDVVRAIMSKVLSRETLANPARFGSTVDTFARAMTVDDGLTKGVIRSTATGLRITGADDIKQLQAPISGFGTSADGQSIDVVDTVRLAELSKAMQTDTVEAYYQKYRK